MDGGGEGGRGRLVVMRRGALRVGSLQDAEMGWRGRRDVGVQCTVYILMWSGKPDQYDGADTCSLLPT